MSVTCHVFQEARDQFLDSLDPQERKEFTTVSSAQELINSLQNLNAVKDDKRLLRKSMQKVKKLSDLLSPYFEVVGILVQSNPEYAALAWGAIRLALQLASNFSHFFEKLATTLETIGKELPQYDKLAELCRNPAFCVSLSPIICPSLVEIYRSLLEFFRSIIRIFKRKDGRSKKTPIVVTSLFWKPFETRFDDLIKRIKFHRKLILDELLLHQLQERLNQSAKEDEDHRKVVESIDLIQIRLDQHAADFAGLKAEFLAAQDVDSINGSRETAYRAILRWLHPPNFVSEYERALCTREQGTTEWLFDTCAFQQWRDMSPPQAIGRSSRSFGSEILWIQGNPGYGKTILASSTIEELKDSTTLPVYYHFSKDDSPDLREADSAYRSALAQTLHDNRRDLDLINKFEFAMCETSKGQMIASETSLLELLLLCTEHLCPYFLVLDGIDECRDNSNMTKAILKLTAASPVKIGVFSRPNVKDLVSMVPRSQRLPLGGSTVADVSLFISRKLDAFNEEGLLPELSFKIEALERLTTGANGMFLWARLMMNYLSSPAMTTDQRLQTILNVRLPEGLSDIYTRITDTIAQAHPVERDLAQWIITWLLYSKRPLSVAELKHTLRLMNTDTCNVPTEIPKFDEVALLTCASLVERDSLSNDEKPQSLVGAFRFVHISVRDYLLDRMNCILDDGSHGSPHHAPKFFLKSQLESKLVMARSCVQFLRYATPIEGLGNCMELSSKPPLALYISFHWTEHLHDVVLALSEHVPARTKAVQGLENYNKAITLLCEWLSNKSGLTSWVESFFSYVNILHLPIILPHLLADRTKQWKHQKIVCLQEVNDLDIRVKELCSKATSLAVYLERLFADWGEQLVKNPSFIWEEEPTAFTPHYLMNASCTTKVHHLNSGNERPDPSAGSSCLCRVSETSADARQVCIVSIWPSRAFQEYTQLRRHSSKVADAACGWWARYEIWSTANLPTALLDISFQLDQDEVLTELWQSFWFDEGNFRLHVPVAVSASTGSFALLRTTYLVESLLDERKTILHRKILQLPPNPSILQYWPTEPLSVVTTPTIRGKDPQTWQRLPLYQYWTDFGLNGRFFLFVDLPLDGSGSTLAMYEISHTNGYAVSMKSQAFCDNLDWEIPRRDTGLITAFHPSKQLVALSDGSSVYLWPFHHGTSQPSKCNITSRQQEALTFSSCGNHLIIVDTQSSYPEMLSMNRSGLDDIDDIPPSESDSSGTIKQSAADKENGNSFAKAASTALGANTGANTDTSTQNINGHWMITSNGTTLGIDPLHNLSDLRLRLWQLQDNPSSSMGSSFHEEEVELSRLPNWRGIGTTKASIQLASQSDSAVKVVLNRPAKGWSNFAEPIDGTFPLLISRDKMTLKRTVDGRRVTCQEAGSLSSRLLGGENASDEKSPECRAKKAKESS